MVALLLPLVGIPAPIVWFGGAQALNNMYPCVCRPGGQGAAPRCSPGSRLELWLLVLWVEIVAGEAGCLEEFCSVGALLVMAPPTRSVLPFTVTL